MTLGSIQFGGLGSGLDTAAIIDAILGVESRPIRLLESRKEAEQEKLSLIGTFEGLVRDLKEKARELGLTSNFFAHELTVGQEGIASFTLSGNAVSGSHTLAVSSLAQADRYAFAGVSDPTLGLGAGTLGFTYDGVSYSVDIAAGSDSLNGIAAAINAAAPEGSTIPAASEAVTASVVNVGTESAPSYQLVITGKQTGADFAIQGLTTSVAGLTGQTQLTTAANAVVVVDGLTVQRSSNVFSDVLAGISFTVSATTTTPLTFTVDTDPAGMKENLQGFVDAYNAVIDFIGKQNTFSLEDGPGGELFGDRLLDSVRSALRRALFEVDPLVAANDPYSTLALVGIESDTDGKLSIDDEVFDAKLSGDLEAFAELFLAPESGLFDRLESEIDGLIKDSTAPNGQAIDGLFDARRAAVHTVIRGFDDQIDRLERNLEKLEESLVRRFSALENLIGGLNAQAAFLASGAFPSTR
jgi:flagellar hook-associated protein 2